MHRLCSFEISHEGNYLVGCLYINLKQVSVGKIADAWLVLVIKLHMKEVILAQGYIRCRTTCQSTQSVACGDTCLKHACSIMQVQCDLGKNNASFCVTTLLIFRQKTMLPCPVPKRKDTL